MDSQENVLQQDKFENEQKTAQAASEVENVSTEEVKAEATPNDKPEAKADNVASNQEVAEAQTDDAEGAPKEETFKKIYANKQEVLARAKEIASSEDAPNKDEVEHLKSAFYRFHVAEREQQQKDYLEAGGDPEKYVVTPDEDEDDFKAQMQVVSEAQACIGRDTKNGSVFRRVGNAVKIFSIMVTWSLENAIETADSMRSRGYGLPGRTAFSIYRFDDRDKTALAWLIFCGAYILSGWLAGAVYFRYYPTVKTAAWTPMTVSFMLVYLALVLTPVILDRKEDRQWKSLRSEI